MNLGGSSLQCIFGIILSPHTRSVREMEVISQELEWMQMGEHRPAFAATSSGGMDTDDTTLI